MEAEDRFLAAKLQKQKDDTKPKQKGDGKQGNGIKMVRRAHFGYCCCCLGCCLFPPLARVLSPSLSCARSLLRALCTDTALLT